MIKTFKNPMHLFIGILFGAFIGFGIIAICNFVNARYQNYTYMKRDLDFYKSTYLRKQGMTSMWPGSNGEPLNYELESFDAGRNWYVMRRDGDNRYVQGNVENVYPGLMKHLKAMDAVFDRVKVHGPLNPTNAEDVEFLKDINITIKAAATN